MKEHTYYIYVQIVNLKKRYYLLLKNVENELSIAAVKININILKIK